MCRNGFVSAIRRARITQVERFPEICAARCVLPQTHPATKNAVTLSKGGGVSIFSKGHSNDGDYSIPIFLGQRPRILLPWRCPSLSHGALYKVELDLLAFRARKRSQVLALAQMHERHWGKRKLKRDEWWTFRMVRRGPTWTSTT
jgi:hypothetical protein